MTNYRMRYGKSEPPSGTPPLPNAEPHNKRSIVAMEYRIFFVGSIWDSAESLKEQRGQLEKALGGALQDKHLNEVFSQYFGDPKDEATATAPSDSVVLQKDWSSKVLQADVEKYVEDLLRAPGDSGFPPDEAGKTFVAVFVLPPGTILDGPRGETENSLRGLAAYHDWFEYTGPPKRTVYYAVAAWSDGQNGCSKPGWQPWQNTCAALYHELAEVRTNPDVRKDPPDQGWYVDMPDHPLTELADLPIIWAGPHPQVMMQEVKLQNGSTVPIQFMWSNAKQAPWDPATALSGTDLGRVPKFEGS